MTEEEVHNIKTFMGMPVGSKHDDNAMTVEMLQKAYEKWRRLKYEKNISSSGYAE